MNQTVTAVPDVAETFDELYFKRLLARANRTITNVRRIDVVELLELAYVDGTLDQFAERLLRSRPELKEEVELGVAEITAN
ncbi:MAG: hypothetical protein EOP04_22570 [Proteobacteria bacterium]|nr:MAG: hypothetical protein EOP04_22570 [Pseudomonadota bacterium]